MLDTRQQPSINPTLGYVTRACQAAVAALLAAGPNEAEDDRVAARAAVPARSSREPGVGPFLTVLVLAATLLCAWAWLRSF
jgi:hypothetical protein